MTEKFLLASNTLVTSATFFACSQSSPSLSLWDKKQRQTAQNNQTKSKQLKSSTKTSKKSQQHKKQNNNYPSLCTHTV
jgi:hypothetical protein